MTLNKYTSINKSARVDSRARLEDPVVISKDSELHANTSLGRYSMLGIGSVIYPNVNVGRFCSIARNVEIGVANHPTSFLSTHAFQINNGGFGEYDQYSNIRKVKSEWFHLPVNIGNDVWIGAKVVVMPKVNIGHGAIVAANAVVTKDVPPYAIVGGVPAKVIRYRFEPDIIRSLLRLKWWDMGLHALRNIKFDNVYAAVRQLEDLKEIYSDAELSES